MNEKCLLILGLMWPEPESSAAGSRMMQLIHLFLGGNYSIVFATPAARNTYSEHLEDLGIKIEVVQPNDEKIKDLLRRVNPGVVLFDRFMIEEQFGWRVAEVCPNALRILDTEDLHFLRKGREMALRAQRLLEEGDLQNIVAKREIAAILRSDISLIISEPEKELLTTNFDIKEDQLWYLPFLEEPIKAEQFEGFPDYKERKNIMFVGNYLHPPNYDAALYLKQTIWPLLRKELPGVELHLYGAYTLGKVKQLQNKAERFYVKGRAKNLDEVLQQYRLLLAPLRYGAGLKGKFFRAIKNGTPSVTTMIGAEGIGDLSTFWGAVEDNPERMVSATVQLYREKNKWQIAREKGIRLFNRKFNKMQFEEPFLEAIREWGLAIKRKRQNHFLGQILMHHRQQSTKFMSRWIEAKNKLNS